MSDEGDFAVETLKELSFEHITVRYVDAGRDNAQYLYSAVLDGKTCVADFNTMLMISQQKAMLRGALGRP